jgi:hypothetical protein
MAVFAIPNPKKILTIDFSIEQVKKGVNNLYLIDNKYKLFNSNDLFNQYTFDLLEFLSLGVYIDINLSRISENKTEITIEVRRKIGTFDQSHEVTKANNHIQLTIDLLSKSMVLNDEQIVELKQSTNIEVVASKNKIGTTQIFLIVIISLLVLVGVVSILMIRSKNAI